MAVGDFASQFFERFDDKHVLVIGAGEMGEETLRYLIDAGVKKISVCNRNFERAEDLAQRMTGQPEKWDRLSALLVEADMVVSATGANEPILTAASFKPIVDARYQRPLLVLDLAIPRDFEPEIGELPGFTCMPSTTCKKPVNATAANASGNGRRPRRSSRMKPSGS